MKISLVIPSYNNLRHLKNAYESVRKHYTDEVELILIDDGSSDGTLKWIKTMARKDKNLIFWREEERVGHTVLYDEGIKKATNEIVGILHADMYIAPNYLENMVKHLQPGKVVCATRVEPPLHPEGKEKIIRDFGMDFDSLKMDAFYKFAKSEMKKSKDKTSRGMFAPWLLYKEDFLLIGGHDRGFAPYPFEDSDIFQRWLLAGYEFVQSRDALVYHLTCRGHRWNDQAGGAIGKNDDQYKVFEDRARKHYTKKWGTWIEIDEYCHPVLKPVYRKKLVIENSRPELEALHDWFNYGDDIVVTIDGNTVTNEDIRYIPLINQLVAKTGQTGSFKVGNIKIQVNKIEDISAKLVLAVN